MVAVVDLEEAAEVAAIAVAFEEDAVVAAIEAAVVEDLVVVAAADAEHRAVVELHAAVAVVEVAREARALRKSPSSPTDMLAFSLHAVKKTIYS